VLQQREFSRLGSNELIPMRARLVFATQRKLEALVAEGKLHADLFYRIKAAKIEVPPLRNRPEDIAAIARCLVHRFSEALQKPMDEIDPAAVSALENYQWPGNVRELENVIQRAVIMASGRAIRIADLDLDA
jgi:DNA-binding NtrC family response regulator